MQESSNRFLPTALPLLLLTLAIPLFAEQLDRELVVRSTRVLTDPELGRAFDTRTVTRAVGTSQGFCVAWRDSRQGGAVMAARIGNDGALLDPLGLLISSSVAATPLAVMKTSEGCSVFFNNGNGSGVNRVALIPWDAVAPTDDVATLPDGALLASDGHRAMFFHYQEDGAAKLVLVDALGRTIAQTVQPRIDPYFLTEWHAAIADDQIFLLGQTSIAGGTSLSLWRSGHDLQFNEIVPRIQGPQSVQADLATDGENALIVLTDHAGDPQKGFLAQLHAPDGALLGSVALTVPPEARLRDVRWVGSWEIAWLHDERTVLVTTDGERELDRREPSHGVETAVAVAEGGSIIRLYRSSDLDEVYEVEGVSDVQRLTFSYPPEGLIDVATRGSRVALLWYEVNPEGDFYRLYATVSTLAQLDVDERFLVAELDDPFDYPWLAAVAMRDDELLIAWSGYRSLHFRRADFDGTWIDPAPVALTETGEGTDRLHFDAHSLVTDDDGYTLVWSEGGEGFEARELVAARIDETGQHIHPLTIEQSETPSDMPMWPSITATDDGYAVAWLVGYPPCRLCTCPAPLNEVRLSHYDSDFVLSGTTGLSPLGSYEAPAMAWSGDELLVVGETASLIRKDGSGNWEEPVAMELDQWNVSMQSSSVTWSGEEFLIAISTARWSWSTEMLGTVVLTLSPDDAIEPVGTDSVVVRDHSSLAWQMQYRPFAIGLGSRVIVLGSEVSAYPDEGLVRRLRETVLAEEASRRRTIRRR